MRLAKLVVVYLLLVVPSFILAQPPDEVPPVEPDAAEEDSLTVSQFDADAALDPDDGVLPTDTPEDTFETVTTEADVFVMPEDPAGVLQALYEALKAGDGQTVLMFISSEALDNVDMMLEALNDELDRDTESTMARLASAGYSVTADEVESWDPEDYLAAAVAVPRMKSRYVIYDMVIGEYTVDNDEVEVPLIFTTSAGAEFPFVSELVLEDGFWKVSTFMGLNSLP